jgi:hypothetical protein
MEKCIFCNFPLDNGQDTVSLRQKGCQGINQASEKRGMNIHLSPGQCVHQECRRRYCNPNNIAADNKKRVLDESPAPESDILLRSARPPFSYREHCLLCGQPDVYNKKKKDVN